MVLNNYSKPRHMAGVFLLTFFLVIARSPDEAIFREQDCFESKDIDSRNDGLELN